MGEPVETVRPMRRVAAIRRLVYLAPIDRGDRDSARS